MSTPAAGAAGTSAGLTEEQLRERGIAKMDQEMRRKFARGGKFNFKIVLRGDSSTGKSTLLRRLRGGTFQPDYNPTPEIRTAHVQWQARSNPEDNIMLEVWDVIDKASKRAISESLTLAHNVDETAEGRHTFPLDATMVDVYHGCHAAIFLIDPSKKWTYEYVQRELATVPEHIPTCVVLNFRDYPASKRLIRLEEVEADMEYSFGKRPFRPFVMEASLLNCYGLQALSTFLHIPFLCLKRASLEQAMQLNTHAIVQAQEAMKTVRGNSYDAYERKIDAATGGSNVSNAQGEAASAGTPGQPPARQSHAAPPTAKEAAITWEKLSNTTLGEAPLLIGGAAIGAAVTGVTAVANLTPAQIAENVKSVASVGNVAKAIGLGPKEKKGHYVDEPVEKVAPQFSHLTGRGGAAAAAFGGREIDDDDDDGAPNSLTPDVRGGEEMDDFFEGDTPRKGGKSGGSSSDEDSDSPRRRDWDSDGGGDGSKVQVRWRSDDDDSSEDDGPNPESDESDDDPLPLPSKDDPFFGSGKSAAPTNVHILGSTHGASSMDLDPSAIAASFGSPAGGGDEYEAVGDDADALEKEFAGNGVTFSGDSDSDGSASRRKKKGSSHKKSKKSKKEKKGKKEKPKMKDWDESESD